MEFKGKFRDAELILFITEFQQPQMVLTNQLAGDREKLQARKYETQYTCMYKF